MRRGQLTLIIIGANGSLSAAAAGDAWIMPISAGRPEPAAVVDLRLLASHILVKPAFHDADTDSDSPDTPTSLRPTRAIS